MTKWNQSVMTSCVCIVMAVLANINSAGAQIAEYEQLNGEVHA